MAFNPSTPMGPAGFFMSAARTFSGLEPAMRLWQVTVRVPPYRGGLVAVYAKSSLFLAPAKNVRCFSALQSRYCIE
jgi:hypothetical protein